MKFRIVLISNDQTERAEIRNVLIGHEDYEIVAEGKNGKEAVALADLLRPDAILMQLQMPELNGTDAAQIIARMQPNILLVGLLPCSSEWCEDSAVSFSMHNVLAKNSLHNLPEILNKTFSSVSYFTTHK